MCPWKHHLEEGTVSLVWTLLMFFWILPILDRLHCLRLLIHSAGKTQQCLLLHILHLQLFLKLKLQLIHIGNYTCDGFHLQLPYPLIFTPRNLCTVYWLSAQRVSSANFTPLPLRVLPVIYFLIPYLLSTPLQDHASHYPVSLTGMSLFHQAFKSEPFFIDTKHMESFSVLSRGRSFVCNLSVSYLRVWMGSDLMWKMGLVRRYALFYRSKQDLSFLSSLQRTGRLIPIGQIPLAVDVVVVVEAVVGPAVETQQSDGREGVVVGAELDLGAISSRPLKQQVPLVVQGFDHLLLVQSACRSLPL